MRNIALYGGAFDPPHIGHIKLAQFLSKVKGVDEVWLLPCGDRQDKKLLLPSAKRLRLIQLLFADNPCIKVSEDQIEMSKKKGKMIPTYELINEIKNKYEGVKFSLTVGADILHTIHTWGNYEKLKSQNPFIVFSRKGYEIPPQKLPTQSLVIQEQLPNISSTEIKRVISEETMTTAEKLKSLSPWLDERVLSFLVQEKMI